MRIMDITHICGTCGGTGFIRSIVNNSGFQFSNYIPCPDCPPVEEEPLTEEEARILGIIGLPVSDTSSPGGNLDAVGNPLD